MTTTRLKSCSKCSAMLPPTSFGKNENQCKKCRSAIKRATEKAQRDLRKRDQQFMSNMDGLTTIQYAMANRNPLELAWGDLRDHNQPADDTRPTPD